MLQLIDDVDRSVTGQQGMMSCHLVNGRTATMAAVLTVKLRIQGVKQRSCHLALSRQLYLSPNRLRLLRAWYRNLIFLPHSR